MNNGRVLQYKRQLGDNPSQLVAFTEAQANSVGSWLESDGLLLNKAIELVKVWNVLGRRAGYKYTIPFVKESTCGVVGVIL